MVKRVFILSFILGFCISIKAYDFEVDGIYYDSLSLKTCEVVRGNGYLTERIIIPMTVKFAGNDYEVVRIGADAFYNQTAVKSVQIPASLTAIGSETFMHCYGLKSIEVDAGNPVYCSYEGALYNKERTRLIFVPAGKTEYKIPSGVNEINDDAFYLCKSLKELTIPNGLSRIGKNAFAGCDSLATIEIPNSIEYIGEYSFCGCKALTSLSIPISVKKIGRSAFSFCTSLKTVTFAMQPGISTIPEGLFNGCTSIVEVTIPHGITSLGDFSFSQCDSLKTIHIPNTVTNIGSNSFYNCHSLKKVEYPASIETIGSQAFEYCQKIDTISIPTKVNMIGQNAFNGCSRLSFINVSKDNLKFKSFFGALYDHQFNRLIKVPPMATSDSIPTTVAEISPYAFFQSAELTSVRFPARLTEIGTWAFVGCSSMDSVYMVNPINISGTYLPQNTRTLYVPIGKKTIFERSTYYLEQYSQFKAIMEYGETPTAILPQVLEELNEEKQVIYNLQGIRIGDSINSLRGIYVINGKKFVLK